MICIGVKPNTGENHVVPGGEFGVAAVRDLSWQRTMEREKTRLEKENLTLRSTPQDRYKFGDILGKGVPKLVFGCQRQALTLLFSASIQLHLTDQVELLEAKRVEYLLELVRLRKQPLSLLMNELGIPSTTDA